MSNGKNWRSYLALIKDPVHVQHYLLGLIYETSGRVFFEGLMQDTDMSLPPTREWYMLHRIAVTKDKIQRMEPMWPTNVIAWGLNIWESDLIDMQRNLMQKFACIRSRNWQNSGSGQGQPIEYSSAYSVAELTYERMRPRFSQSSVSPGKDYEWYMIAMCRIVRSCWMNTYFALKCGYYNTADGSLTEAGDANWQELLAHAAKNDGKHGFDAATALQQQDRDTGNDKSCDRPFGETILESTPTNKRKFDHDIETGAKYHTTKRQAVTN